MKLKSNNWFWYVFGIACIFVCVAPWAFTRPYQWNFFDFSRTGDVGDTIGGITAPIIGLLSIFFLIKTLLEQIKINKEQLKFNYATRILSLVTYITQAANNISFTYFSSRETKGVGLGDVIKLKKTSNGNTRILEVDFIKLFDSIKDIDNSLGLLYAILKNHESNLEDVPKYVTINFLIDYYGKLSFFYSLVNKSEIDTPRSDNQEYHNILDGDISLAKQLYEKALEKIKYLENIKRELIVEVNQ